MRIALNAQLLSFSASYRQAGISRLIHATIQGLQTVDHENDYTVYVGDRRIPPDYLTNTHWQMASARLPTGNRIVRILWEQLVLPWAVLRQRADMLHALAFAGPLVGRCPLVVTVYDASFLLFPAAFNRLNRWYLGTITPLSVRKARRVIAISESTKRDLVRLTGVPADRVTVVYPGLEPDIRRVTDAAAVREFRRRHKLPDHFVLYVGTLEPRKNVAALVRAYARLRQRGEIDCPLVLAGGKGWRCDSIFAAIEESGVARDIVLPGYVPHADLPLWYSAADVFVYPSLYEGFGLPVLEAMACGAPVISSTASSLPEVAGDAGVLIDPNDIDALAGAIKQVARSPDLRAALSAQGMARASAFTWERMARQTRAVYEQAFPNRMA
jgi:glycosyltransferase involved in cell wall biosynthesis